MGSTEEEKSAKSEKSSSPAQLEQSNIAMYPDWAAMQAYYGPRVALPPYYQAALASGQAPHPYMWGPPQPMMPPYGAHYAAMYSHGSVYPHPTVAHAATPLSMETPTKSSENTERGLMKKLKQFDGLAMSIGNGNAESDQGEDRLSQSVDTEGSSDGSDGNTSGVDQMKKRRSRDGTPISGGDGKNHNSRFRAGEANTASNKAVSAVVAPATTVGKMVRPVLSSDTTTTLELKNPPSSNAETSVPQAYSVQPELLQNERELKREKRKQSNRESARRSRLRKQAETEELGNKVETLKVENVALKSEINRLIENSEKLKLENATLMEKLKMAQGHATELISKVENIKVPPISTENLLSRVNNSGSADRSCEGDSEMFDRNSKPSAKLHQLLDTNLRADAVAAS